jgi:hypothetical protein
MKSFNLKAVTFAGILSLGLFSGLAAAQPADNKAPETSPMCHEVTRKVAVYPTAGHPSKSVRLPRFETRTYTVCDHDKMKSKPERSAATQADRPAQD